MEKTKILFICTGNICRSPAAEAILKTKIHEAALDAHFEIDSAGIYNYHEGESSDPRMRSAAAARGYMLTSTSRPVTKNDFTYFDWIIDMDDYNTRHLKAMAPDPHASQKIRRITDFCRTRRTDHIPDPYYGGTHGFTHVLDLLEEACDGIIHTFAPPPENK
ncbi:MAG: low molecular weight phosphotyrosine protein phosphatase [Tannerella sp.]|jgi:protein-tyrosine phosphatase|nr:low molecular weight phosphotyrosine protein phosphatase [Tannerella sp.]